MLFTTNSYNIPTPDANSPRSLPPERRSFLRTSRERVHPVLPQHELNLPVHVLVVDGFALFEVHPTPRLEWLLVEAGPAELVEDFLFPKDAVQHPASFLDVVVLHQHRTGDELYVTHFARVVTGDGDCVNLEG